MATKGGINTENFEQVVVCSQEELREWLTAHHTQEKSVWLVTYKKSYGKHFVSTDMVLDELIAFGWIDGIRRKLNEHQTMQLIGPRRQQHWSKTYKDRAARLENEGTMTEAGRKAIKASKKSGLWTFMDDVDALIKPQDLIEALDKLPNARETFDDFSPSVQRFALRDIKLAKTENTRKKRIADVTARSARGELPKGVRMVNK